MRINVSLQHFEENYEKFDGNYRHKYTHQFFKLIFETDEYIVLESLDG